MGNTFFPTPAWKSIVNVFVRRVAEVEVVHLVRRSLAGCGRAATWRFPVFADGMAEHSDRARRGLYIPRGPRRGRPCQQTRPVNWRKRRIRRRSGPRWAKGTVRPRAAACSPESCETRNTCQMLRIPAGFRRGVMLSTKWKSEFETEFVAPRHGFEPRT